EHFQRAYTVTQETKDRWFRAYCLNEIGNVARALGDYNQARQHYQAAYDLRQAFDDPEGMAVALNNLGGIAQLQKEYHTAERLYRQSLAIYRDIGDKGGLAAALNGLGQTISVQGNDRAVQDHLQEALQITTQIQFVPLTLAILMSVGEWLLRTGRAELGVALLAFIQHHPAGDQETKARAQQCLTDYTADLNADDVARATQRGQSSSLETVIAAAQVHLAAPVEAEEEMISPAPERSLSMGPLPRSPALIEPLTERELEVLHLIAEGLTNREIAEQLSVVIGTVKAHNNSIYGKLGVGNRVQALTRARELGLL
ncbi:MAG TPA: tetratricopeptide repeat protein, partial [Anaerolineae bacterium]